MQMIYNLVLYLLRLSNGSAFEPLTYKSLLLANKPLGGNISPAVLLNLWTGFSGGLQFSTLTPSSVTSVPIATLCVLENCRHHTLRPCFRQAGM